MFAAIVSKRVAQPLDKASMRFGVGGVRVGDCKITRVRFDHRVEEFSQRSPSPQADGQLIWQQGDAMAGQQGRQNVMGVTKRAVATAVN